MDFFKAKTMNAPLSGVESRRTVVWQRSGISRQERQSRQNHRAFIAWFTGLSGAGKSTLAAAVEQHLHDKGCRTILLDGDNIRHGLSQDLGFSEADRAENLRRVAEVSKLFLEAGVIVLAAFVSPSHAERQRVRAMFDPQDFLEIHCDCSLEVCERRDVKGLYRQARQGAIPNFTGVSAAYERPDCPDILLNTESDALDLCVEKVLQRIRTIIPQA